ncbi:MAG: hypothetical protein M1820_003703 [Bogoriella megaspora]|nr:MAG: hypothetical protein M1820_003703 [Bogoriella megaspora]
MATSLDAAGLSTLLDNLDGDIDNIEQALQPLLERALSETTSKLPLLDKAKLYVTVAYAIESIIFSYLRLNGANAKEHPVFRELTRVKQYFEKVKQAEEKETRPNMAIDKGAACRFIKAGIHTRFDDNGSPKPFPKTPQYKMEYASSQDKTRKRRAEGDDGDEKKKSRRSR